MKKLLIMLMFMIGFAFADVKLDFLVSVRRMGCETIQWIENDYESGVKWKYYGKFACKELNKVPVKIVGLKYLDVSRNLKGELVFTYGLEE